MIATKPISEVKYFFHAEMIDNHKIMFIIPRYFVAIIPSEVMASERLEVLDVKRKQK